MKLINTIDFAVLFVWIWMEIEQETLWILRNCSIIVYGFSSSSTMEVRFLEYCDKISVFNCLEIIKYFFLVFVKFYLSFANFFGILLYLQHLQQSDDEFSCPFCRHTFNVENVDYLPDNVMLLRKVMEFTNHQPANSQGPLAYSESNYSTALYGLYCTILNLFTFIFV